MRQGEALAKQEALKLLDLLGTPEPPTPLHLALQLHDLSQHFVSKAEQLELPIANVSDLVRGVLDAPEKCIYVIEDKHVRRRFVSAHEIGHFVIPEHNELLRMCSVWDLRPDARKQLEREANTFAATLLTHGARFSDEFRDLRFSLGVLRTQCDRYEMSYEAGMRHFIEGHSDPVALAVCKPRASAGAGLDAAVLQYWVASAPYRRRGLPIPQTKQVFGPDHFVGICVQQGAGDYYGEVNFASAGVRLPASVFFNSYSVMVLIGAGTGSEDQAA